MLLKTNDGRGGDENDLCLIIMTQNEIILFWNVDPSTHKKKKNNCTLSHQGFTKAYQGFIRAATVCNSLCKRKRNRDAVKNCCR